MREKGAGAPRALQGDLEPSAAAAAPRRWGREWEAKEALEINSPPLCCRRLPPPRALPAFFRRSRVFRVRAAGPHLLRGTLALVHLSGGSPAQPSGSTAAAFQSVSPRPLCLVSAPRSIRPRGPSSSPRGTHGRGVVAAGGGRAAQREPGEAPTECLYLAMVYTGPRESRLISLRFAKIELPLRGGGGFARYTYRPGRSSRQLAAHSNAFVRPTFFFISLASSAFAFQQTLSSDKV